MTPKDITLSDGFVIPQLGFGTSQLKAVGEAERAVAHALRVGYRLIDTATMYGNEEEVGKGIKLSGINRKEVIVTTKIWPDEFERVEEALNDSLNRLALDYIDIYLIHFPKPGYNTKVWRKLIDAKQQGLIRSIGVSNFTEKDLEEIIKDTDESPTINQIEIHPRFQQRDLRSFNEKHGITSEAWMPLGRAKLLDEKTIVKLARKYGKSPAQIILRWHMQSAIIAIPKSTNGQRIEENFSIFDFELSQVDMKSINDMDAGMRLGASPDRFGT